MTGNSSLSNRDFWVGEWLVHPRLARVRRGDETVRVTPRAMAVLVHLAQANGAVISRNDILDAVWPRMAVTPDALSQCIVELRRVFADDSKSPRTIETIPRMGVRLLAPVKPVPEPPLVAEPPAGTAASSLPETREAVTPPTPVHSVVAESAARRRWLWPGAAAALAIAIAVGAVAFWPIEGADGPQPADTDRGSHARSIAVLPISYESTADDSVQFFANAIHDELLSRLAKIGALDKVISRTAVMGYRGTEKTAREIGRELAVETVLEGRVHRVADAVRLNVQLIDAETNGILWSDTYTETLTAENFFSIQTELTVAIADALDAALSPDELARLREVPTKSQRAHDFYLSGNEYFRRINEPQRMFPLAVQQYTRATEQDPSFALAWARLGIAHMGVYGYGIDRAPSRLALAEHAIRTAFDLVPGLPEAHLAKATYLSRGLADNHGALAEYAIAERLIPQDADLYFLRASVHSRLGEWDLSITDNEKALALDPRNVVYLRQQAQTYMFKRDYTRVEQDLGRILEIAPDDGTAHVDLAHLALYWGGETALANRYESTPPSASYSGALAATYVRWLAAIFDRDYARALSILDKSTEDPVFDGDLRNSYSPKSLLYARTHILAGNRDEATLQFELARNAIEQQLKSYEGNRRAAAPLHVALAEVQAALGNREGAAASLERAGNVMDAMLSSGVQLASVIRVLLALGDVERSLRELDDYLSKPGRWTIEGLLADPRLDPIRNDPRFAALVEKHARK